MGRYKKGDIMEESKPNMLAYSQLPMVIEELEKRIKTIPQDQLIALGVIRALLEIVNMYGQYVDGLKKELIKLDSLNKSQAKMIQNTCKIIPNGV